MQQQQDMYKFIHDQTVRLANIGYTPKEIAEKLRLPKSLAGNFHLRGYYGTLSHNSKAVYQHYFGWYEGNPAQLNPLPPVESSLRYVEFMGGADAILKKAEVYLDKGEYRWVGEVLNHVVFAEPGNMPARNMLAEAYRQMGYQAESGPWRDIYLSGAKELSEGTVGENLSVFLLEDFMLQVPMIEFMKALSVTLDADKAEGERLKINILFTELEQNFVLSIRNSVMHYREKPTDPSADASIAISGSLFFQIMMKQVGITDLLTSEELEVEGSVLKLIKFFSLLGESNDNFNIVTP
jgi:alkyl sulfatase BDS1-like metallo-beta-lactamase superfamily hydrolase